jgi:DNA-binding response OmpR family regulator
MRATVLIVDDDPGAAEAFCPMLNSHGYDVHVAPDAESGLREVDRCAPVAIVVDLHLPTIDGVEFVRRLRVSVRHSSIPAAVVTGDYMVDGAIIAELQNLGVRLFFKPLWEDDLNRIIRDLIRVHAAGADVGAPLP